MSMICTRGFGESQSGHAAICTRGYSLAVLPTTAFVFIRNTIQQAFKRVKLSDG